MHNEPATEILKPALDALDAAKARCHELAQRLEALAGPDVVTALLVYVQANEDLEKAFDVIGAAGYKNAPPEVQQMFGNASAAENKALKRLRDLGRAIRAAHAEKAAAAE